MQVFSTGHFPSWAVDTLFNALLRITAYVYRTTCCIVPVTALNGTQARSIDVAYYG